MRFNWFTHDISTALYCDKTLLGYKLGYRLVLGLGYGLAHCYWLRPNQHPKPYPNPNTNLYPNKFLSQYRARNN